MDKQNISIENMLQYSKELYEKHKKDWGEATPESNVFLITWLIAEIGEVIDIVKKKGAERIMSDKHTRKEFLTEVADCYIYLADMLNRYGISAKEFSQAYVAKVDYNLKRDFKNSKTKADKKLNGSNN